MPSSARKSPSEFNTGVPEGGGRSKKDEGQEEAPMPPQPQPSQQPPQPPPTPDLSGRDVRIRNLQSKPEYNGVRARCIKWYKSRGRYSVRVPHQTGHYTMLLKPSCVEALISPDDDDAAAATAIERLSLLESLDPRDNLEDAIHYIQNGRIHTVSFVKHLPHTANGIQRGEIDPDLFAESLTDVMFEKENKKNHPGMVSWPLFSNIFEKSPWIYVGHVLASYAVPPDWFRGGKAGELRTRVCVDLAHVLFENYKNLRKNRHIHTYEDAFGMSCIQCADMIDREVFNGERGNFIRQCPLLVNNCQQAATLIREANECVMKFHCMNQQLMCAAKEAKKGAHEPERACWECQEPIVSTSSTCCCVCGGCSLAGYCSRDCQSKAWKGGHKVKCSQLLLEYQACEESFAFVEAFYAKKQEQFLTPDGVPLPLIPPVHHGVLLNHELDCLLVSFLHSSKTWDRHYLGGTPSMELFYENLGKVALGEWWIWPSSETDSLATYKAKIGNEDDFDYFFSLLYIMPYPIANGQNLDGVISAIWSGAGIRVPMPAEQFLETYKKYGMIMSEGPDERSVRYRRQKCGVLQKLKDTFHK